jgi:hypothetical protein
MDGERLGQSRGDADGPARGAAMAGIGLGLPIAATMLAVLSALAADPAVQCQQKKLKAAAKYAACRLSAEAKGVKDGSPPIFAKCDLKFGVAWQRAEAQAAGQCATAG